MRKPLVALTALLASLFLPDAADAARHLSMAVARRSIVNYERLYWRSPRLPVHVSDCTRQSPVQVSCLAAVLFSDTWVRSRDWVTLLPQNVIRVHTGYSETVYLLA